MGFIGKHWKGGYPLGISFWLIFVLLTAVYHYIEPLLQRPFADRPVAFIGVTIAYVIVSRLIIFPWQVVGLLRSTDRHYLAHRRAIVRYGVQAAIVASLALTVAHIIGAAQSLVIYKEKMDFAATRGHKAYTLELDQQAGLLRLKGPLDFGIVEAVEKTLDRNPWIKGIVLDSQGGQVYEGRGLAILIDARGLNTYSFDGCSSACSTAFIGGRQRYLGDNARLGFHRYRLDSGNIQQFYKFYDLSTEEKKDLAIFKSKNLSEEFLLKMFQTPHDRMWFPDVRTLLDAGVIHGTVDEPAL